MPIATVGDIQLMYEIAGSGPRVLLLNGTGADLRRKPSLLDRPWAGRFEVLSFDQRGMGRSSKPDRPYSMADYAADAAGLLEAVGWARAHVFGISFGGMVAQELAVRYPAKVDRLALACTAAGGAGGSSYPIHDLAELPLLERAAKVLSLDLRNAASPLGVSAEAIKAAADQILARAKPFDAADAEALVIGTKRQLQARACHDTWDRLPGLTMPTAVFAGRHDGQAPLAAVTALAGRIPGATLQVFEGAHTFLQEDPAALEAVADFLQA